MWPIFPGETKTESSEHGETARNTSLRPIAGGGICKALVVAMIFCHASTLHDRVGH
jgi:hypothetical protein